MSENEEEQLESALLDIEKQFQAISFNKFDEESCIELLEWVSAVLCHEDLDMRFEMSQMKEGLEERFREGKDTFNEIKLEMSNFERKIHVN